LDKIGKKLERVPRGKAGLDKASRLNQPINRRDTMLSNVAAKKDGYRKPNPSELMTEIMMHGPALRNILRM